MAITYGFFNSVDGDRRYDADEMSQYFDGLVSDGVYEMVGGALQVKAVSGGGMTVQVQTGRAIIECKWLRNDAVLTLEITQAHVTLNRWTAVVVRLDRVNRLMTITTKDGTSASSPVKPAMTRDASVYELCLAYIYVGAGATSIIQSDITDMRPSSACGWITGLVKQVDTSQLFLQWQTAYENYYAQMTQEFDEWFSTLTELLNVNTYIQAYRKRVTYTGSETTETHKIPLDMTGYTYEESDIIEVHINGLKGCENVDYTLDTTTTPYSINPVAASAGTVVDIEVLKSRIGFYTLVGADDDVIVGSDNADVIIE